jgi:hypothetical protein
MSNPQVEIECAVVRHTDAAILIDIGGEKNHWVPRSQISDYTPGPEGEGIEHCESIFIPLWLATEKGLV